MIGRLGFKHRESVAPPVPAGSLMFTVLGESDHTLTLSGDYTIDWGDGTQETISSSTATHTYSGVGDWTISIWDWTGNSGSIVPFVGRDIQFLQWGNVEIRGLESFFKGTGVNNLDYQATDTPSFFGTGISLKDCFTVTNLTDPNLDLTSWDVSEVTNMESVFVSSSFNGDVSNWDTGKVTTMSRMFNSSDFNGDVSSWDVSSVTDMSSMFQFTPFLGDVSSWDVSNVTTMNGMFKKSNVYTGLANYNFQNWDVSSVTDMNDMFGGEVRISSLDPIKGWDVSNVTTMNSMFDNNPWFNEDLSSWDVSEVTNMIYMFNGTNYTQDLSDWCVPLISTRPTMFSPMASSNEPSWGACPLIGNGLVSYNTMDRNSGTTFGYNEVGINYSRNGQLWTINNGARDYAVEVDGAVDNTTALYQSNALIDPSQSFSVSAWAWSYDNTTDPKCIVGLSKASGSLSYFFRLYNRFGDLTVRWEVSDPNNNIIERTIGDFPPLNEWVHVGMSYDSSTNVVKGYINGVKELDTTIPTFGPRGTYGNSTAIGNAYQGSNQAWRGRLDEVGMWQRVLSERDMKVLYNNGDGVFFFPDE